MVWGLSTSLWGEWRVPSTTETELNWSVDRGTWLAPGSMRLQVGPTQHLSTAAGLGRTFSQASEGVTGSKLVPAELTDEETAGSLTQTGCVCAFTPLESDCKDIPLLVRVQLRGAIYPRKITGWKEWPRFHKFSWNYRCYHFNTAWKTKRAMRE